MCSTPTKRSPTGGTIAPSAPILVLDHDLGLYSVVHLFYHRVSRIFASRSSSDDPPASASGEVQHQRSSIVTAIVHPNARLLPQTPLRPELIPAINGADANGPPSVTGNHALFVVADNIGDRTGRVSTPGYQTPFVDNLNRRNFSDLAKTAPVSYDTLQRNGFLDTAGTPARKYSSAAHNKRRSSYDEELYSQSEEVIGNLDRSAVRFEEVQRPAEGVKAQWAENKSDVRVQHSSAAN